MIKPRRVVIKPRKVAIKPRKEKVKVTTKQRKAVIKPRRVKERLKMKVMSRSSSLTQPQHHKKLSTLRNQFILKEIFQSSEKSQWFMKPQESFMKPLELFMKPQELFTRLQELSVKPQLSFTHIMLLRLWEPSQLWAPMLSLPLEPNRFQLLQDQHRLLHPSHQHLILTIMKLPCIRSHSHKHCWAEASETGIYPTLNHLVLFLDSDHYK